MRSPLYFCLAAAMVLTGCASTDDTPEYASLDEDPRVGDRVGRVCFPRSISGFSDYQDGDGLVLHKGRSERFLVTFAGPCFAAGNAFSLQLQTNRGFTQTGCLSTGDRIFLSSSPTGGQTSNPFDSDTCLIRDIYTFDPDAAKAEESEEEAS